MNLTEGERQELESLQRKRTAAMAQVRRARLILMLDDGASRDTIKSELKCDSRFIATWKTRFAGERLVFAWSAPGTSAATRLGAT